MQVSRRELYALGEPFGTSCTQKKPGGRGVVYGGGGGGSSSSATTQTFNTDKRLITGEGSIGLSLDDSVSYIELSPTDARAFTDSRAFTSADVSNSNNTTNLTTVDGGAIAGSFGVANNALNTITSAISNAFSSNSGIAGDAFNFASESASRALGFGESALNTVELNNATLGDGFGRLLDAADSLFERGENLIGQTGDRVADAYRTATVEKSGSIDNKTITVIAIAGAVALIALNARK